MPRGRAQPRAFPIGPQSCLPRAHSLTPGCGTELCRQREASTESLSQAHTELLPPRVQTRRLHSRRPPAPPHCRTTAFLGAAPLVFTLICLFIVMQKSMMKYMTRMGQNTGTLKASKKVQTMATRMPLVAACLEGRGEGERTSPDSVALQELHGNAPCGAQCSSVLPEPHAV